MSGSPLSAIGAAEALGGGALALWRQAQAQMAQQAEPAAPASQLREEAAQPAAPAQALAQQPATPMRLSELRLDASHLAHALPPLHRQGSADAPQAEEMLRPGDAADVAAEPPAEHWLVTLARRWTTTDLAGAQRALQLARTQWAAGRRMLFVCGRRSPGREGAGWAALLMGRPGPAGLALEGPRWPVQLMWPAPPLATRWFSARLLKEAAPGLSWQMSPCPIPGDTHVATALLIGPVLEAERRWTQLGVRLDAGSAFRAALGTQWSLWLVSTRGVWMDE